MRDMSKEILLDTLLTAVVAALQLLALQYHVKLPKVLQVMLDAPGRAAAGSSAGSRLGGGGTPSAPHQDCRPWLTTACLPWVRQQSQVQPEGAETKTWYNDCGEACVASVVAAARGVPLQPDWVRLQYGGVLGQALTSSSALVGMLAVNNVSAVERHWPDEVDLKNLAAVTGDGRPCLALGYWPNPGSVLHWMLAFKVDNAGVHCINPWSGTHEALSVDEWHQFTANEYVEVTAHLLYEDEEIPF